MARNSAQKLDRLPSAIEMKSQLRDNDNEVIEL